MINQSKHLRGGTCSPVIRVEVLEGDFVSSCRLELHRIHFCPDSLIVADGIQDNQLQSSQV